jgi:hypothetical protein
LAVLGLAGCSALPHAKPTLDAKAGLFDSATLVYRLDASRLGVPLALARVEGQRVAYEEVASTPQPGESTGTLIVSYPHPAGGTNLAQAKVIVESGGVRIDQTEGWLFVQKRSKYRPAVREEWVLDIPRDELGHALEQLQNTGFFREGGPDGGAEVTAQLNLRKVKKTWAPVPALDELMRRVRSQGELVSYTRDPHSAALARRVSSSARHYQALAACQGSLSLR